MLLELIIAGSAGVLALGVLFILSRRAGLHGPELRAIARDPRIPRWLRAMFVVALLPIPGPVDEIVGGLAMFILLRRLPHVVSDHRRPRQPARSSKIR